MPAGTTQPPLELRPTREGDLPAVSVLFEKRFGHGLLPEEWGWKYGQFAAHGIGESRSWVAVAPDGEVVAHAGALGFPARWAEGEGIAWQLVDFAGTTSRRGLRSAFVDLGRALLADLPRRHDVPFLFGFPSARHFKLGGRVFGYLPLTEVEVLAGDLPPDEGPEGVVEVFDQAFPEVESIWAACGVLGVVRSALFLNWRYYARPGRYYRFYRLSAGGIQGLAVFAFSGDEARAAELWLPAMEPSVDWRPSLLGVAADLRGLGAGLRRWRFWEPAQAGAHHLLEGLGLVSNGERQFVGCRGGEGGPDPQAAAHGFTYSMGDFDLT